MDDAADELKSFVWDWEQSYLDVIAADEPAGKAGNSLPPLADWSVMNQVSILMLPGEEPPISPTPFDFQEPVAENDLVNPEELLAQLLSSTDVAGMIQQGPAQEAAIIQLGPSTTPEQRPSAAAPPEDAGSPPAPPPEPAVPDAAQIEVPEAGTIEITPKGFTWDQIEAIAEANTMPASVELPASLPEEPALDQPWAAPAGLPGLPGWAAALLIGIGGGALAALLLWSGPGGVHQLTSSAPTALLDAASTTPRPPVLPPPSAVPATRLVVQMPSAGLLPPAPAPPLVPRGSQSAAREARARLRASLLADDLPVGREDPFVTAQPLADRPYSAFVTPYNPLILPYPPSPPAFRAAAPGPAQAGETRIKLRLIGVIAAPLPMGLVDLSVDGQSYRLQVRTGSRLPGGLTVASLGMRAITVRADRGEMTVPLGEAREARVSG